MTDVRLIDAKLLTTNIAQIAKACAKSDKQKALVGRILFMIENMPTIKAELVKHGRWENGHCTHCGEDVASKLDTWTDVQNFIYCPSCGSKNRMDSDSE